MHPPAHVCKALYLKRPDLRLSWEGHSGNPDELNEGNFCIVRLVPQRQAGTPEDPHVVEDFWDTKLAFNEKYGDFSHVRAERGPIFNRRGGLVRDWDALSLVPVIVQRCTESRGMTTEDIFSGRFLKMFAIIDHDEVRRQEHARAEEDGRDLDRVVNDGIDASTDRVWSAASKTGETRNIIARKFLSEEERGGRDTSVNSTAWLKRKRGLTP